MINIFSFYYVLNKKKSNYLQSYFFLELFYFLQFHNILHSCICQQFLHGSVLNAFITTYGQMSTYLVNIGLLI